MSCYSFPLSRFSFSFILAFLIPTFHNFSQNLISRLFPCLLSLLSLPMHLLPSLFFSQQVPTDPCWSLAFPAQFLAPVFQLANDPRSKLKTELWSDSNSLWWSPPIKEPTLGGSCLCCDLPFLESKAKQKLKFYHTPSLQWKMYFFPFQKHADIAKFIAYFKKKLWLMETSTFKIFPAIWVK